MGSEVLASGVRAGRYSSYVSLIIRHRWMKGACHLTSTPTQPPHTHNLTTTYCTLCWKTPHNTTASITIHKTPLTGWWLADAVTAQFTAAYKHTYYKHTAIINRPQGEHLPTLRLVCKPHSAPSNLPGRRSRLSVTNSCDLGKYCLWHPGNQIRRGEREWGVRESKCQTDYKQVAQQKCETYLHHEFLWAWETEQTETAKSNKQQWIFQPLVP